LHGECDCDSTRSFSAGPIGHESASEGPEDPGEEEDNCLSDKSYLGDHLGFLDKDGMDIEPWQHGISAVGALAEEFERQVAQAGMHRRHRRRFAK
jgi:predicted amidohydrolase YtcJ